MTKTVAAFGQRFARFALAGAMALCLLTQSFTIQAAEEILKDDHPDRYVVQEGDTLWDIASMFLTDAWMWPEIWHVNANIENPHLIFPGDVIALTYIDGKPRLALERGEAGRTVRLSPMETYSRAENVTVKAEPKIRVQPLADAIPAIPLDAVSSLLNTGRIVDQFTLDEAPYILAGVADRLIFGPGDEFYARGNWPAEEVEAFGIFRKGDVYLDPETREVLGFEAREVGSARVVDDDDGVYTMTMTSVKEDVRLGDRLLPTEQRRVESTFYPSPPKEQVEGAIMTLLGGLTQVGRNDVVAINRGSVHGLEVGNVLEVSKSGRLTRDRISRELIELPSERAGLLMVFRLFDKMAYGLILETEEPIKVGDRFANPG